MSTAPFRDREVRSGRSWNREVLERERDRSQNDCYTTFVTNLPIGFTWRDLKDLFNHEVGEVTYADVGNNGTGIVEFPSGRSADVAVSTMNGYKIDGRQIYITKDFTGEHRKRVKGAQNINKPEYMDDEITPTYYGLNKQFVESLGISLPLVNRAFIMNLDFRVDAAKLKEIFSMAGQVHHIDLWRTAEGVSKGMAVIQYDHPVEVVQAISMFHNQMMYERPMVVRMDRQLKREFALPEGLEGVGPGLGPEGAPLRNVALHILKQEEEKEKKINDRTDNFPNDWPDDFNDYSIGQMNHSNNQMNRPNGQMNRPNNEMNHPDNQTNHPRNQMNHPESQMNHPENQMNYPMWRSNSNSMNSNRTVNIPKVQIVPMERLMNDKMNVAPNQMNVRPKLNSPDAQIGTVQTPATTTPNSTNDNNASGINAKALLALLNLQNQIQQQGLSVSDLPKLLSSMGSQGGSDKDNNSKPKSAQDSKPVSPDQLKRSGPNGSQKRMFRKAKAKEVELLSGSHSWLKYVTEKRRSNQNEESNIEASSHVEGTSYKDSNAPDKPKSYQSDMVIVSNLPDSVTPQMVHEKFGEVGNVKFVDMMSPGSALVRYTSNWDAEQAIKMFHRSRVNGTVISVDYF